MLLTSVMNWLQLLFVLFRKRYSYAMVLFGVVVVALALVKPVVNAFILLSVSIPAAILVIREMRK